MHPAGSSGFLSIPGTETVCQTIPYKLNIYIVLRKTAINNDRVVLQPSYPVGDGEPVQFFETVDIGECCESGVIPSKRINRNIGRL
jgi:hypothetical protein